NGPLSIGGTDNGSGNVIAFNTGHGVYVMGAKSAQTRIQANSIHSNSLLGINLEGGTETAAGVTANDLDDNDAGPNGLQNYPEFTLVNMANGNVYAFGEFRSRPDSTYLLEFFTSPAADPSGHGEGRTFVGSQSVTTN